MIFSAPAPAICQLLPRILDSMHRRRDLLDQVICTQRPEVIEKPTPSVDDSIKRGVPLGIGENIGLSLQIAEGHTVVQSNVSLPSLVIGLLQEGILPRRRSPLAPLYARKQLDALPLRMSVDVCVSVCRLRIAPVTRRYEPVHVSAAVLAEPRRERMS